MSHCIKRVVLFLLCHFICAIDTFWKYCIRPSTEIWWEVNCCQFSYKLKLEKLAAKTKLNWMFVFLKTVYLVFFLDLSLLFFKCFHNALVYASFGNFFHLHFDIHVIAKLISLKFSHWWLLQSLISNTIVRISLINQSLCRTCYNSQLEPREIYWCVV